jgi:hypothetical protein
VAQACPPQAGFSLRVSFLRSLTPQAEMAAEKARRAVILSEAKNLSCM